MYMQKNLITVLIMILRLCNKIIYIWLTYYIWDWKQYHSNSPLSIHMNMIMKKNYPIEEVALDLLTIHVSSLLA